MSIVHHENKLLHGRVQALIDREALTHNYMVLSEGAAVDPKVKTVAVVKANAYGHGVKNVVQTLWGCGCRHYAVATLEEALEVARIVDDTPALLLVLGYVPPVSVLDAAQNDLTVTCVSYEHAQALSLVADSAGITVKCHIALDTGMNRIGLPAHHEAEIMTAVQDALEIMKMPGLEVTGMFTHFALADEAYDAAISPTGLTMTQYTRYKAVYDGLVAAGSRPAFCHICNSAAAIRLPCLYPEVCFDGVRFGISLYGYGVSPAPHHTYALRPVMILTTHVVHLHDLFPGEIVSYGGRYRADTQRKIATLPIGYADGFRRGFEGGIVTFHSANGDLSAPMVGRVCMDQCMVDVTGLPVAVGDEVTLFGRSTPLFDAPQAALEALCIRAETIPYEILCQITARVPRILI